MNFEQILTNAVAGVSATLSKPGPCRRFAYPISKETAAKLLAQAYRVEVEARGYTYAPAQDTAAHLTAVAVWLTDATRKPSLLLYGSTPGTGKTTTAQAVKRMAEALHASMLASIEAAKGSIWEQQQAHFAGWPTIPWPEGLSPEELPAPEGMRKRREWCETHPEEAAIIEEKEAEKRAAIDAWRQPFEREIEAAQARADGLAGMLPRYVTAQALADMVKGRDFAGYYGFVNASFLILDDMGTEPVTVKDFGNEVLPVTELLLKRYEARRPTIITTNLSETAIANTYGPRILDRLNEICNKIPYGGNSFRR